MIRVKPLLASPRRSRCCRSKQRAARVVAQGEPAELLLLKPEGEAGTFRVVRILRF